VDISWNDLLAAVALLLILEGIIPFINPQILRKLLETMSRLDDRVIRLTGLTSMIAGVVLLYLVR
jgi:uncharacterized protein YjeT (DUF2065 family)